MRGEGILLLETDPDVAKNELQHIIRNLKTLTKERSFNILAESFDTDPIEIPSSVSRELLYLLEHAIHHMAIIRLLVKSHCPGHQLPKEFGVAYSYPPLSRGICKLKRMLKVVPLRIELKYGFNGSSNGNSGHGTFSIFQLHFIGSG